MLTQGSELAMKRGQYWHDNGTIYVKSFHQDLGNKPLLLEAKSNCLSPQVGIWVESGDSIKTLRSLQDMVSRSFEKKQLI